MYDAFQVLVVTVLAIVFGLSWLAKRFPDVAWLQAFRHVFPRLSEEQRARLRRRQSVYAGIELILIGLVIPMGYVVLTVMFFNSFTTVGTVLVVGASLLCIGLGITAIWLNRKA